MAIIKTKERETSREANDKNSKVTSRQHQIRSASAAAVMAKIMTQITALTSKVRTQKKTYAVSTGVKITGRNKSISPTVIGCE